MKKDEIEFIMKSSPGFYVFKITFGGLYIKKKED